MTTFFGQQRRPSIHVYVTFDNARSEYTFTEPFRIGRDESCGVHIDSGLVSRTHISATFEDGRWWIEDLNSTNGTFIDGRRIKREAVDDAEVVRIGEDGPVLHFSVGASGSDPERMSGAGNRVRSDRPASKDEPTTGRAGSDVRRFGSDVETRVGANARPSESDYQRRYFEDIDGPAGEHTMMIRRAFKSVQKKQTRKYRWLIGGMVVVVIGVFGLVVVQQMWLHRLEDRVADLHYSLREIDRLIAQSITENPELARTQLAQRQVRAQRYDEVMEDLQYIEEFGIRRAPTEKERVIFKVARIFNEYERDMPPSFIRAVQDTIRSYWQEGSGRYRLVNAIERAQKNGYVGPIVRTFEQYGLPPHFFYLALQESDFNAEAIGPWTRFGHAKGMWQFIPDTGAKFGLFIPAESAESGRFFPEDERHDFRLSTVAAAQYIRFIYTELSYASGLLTVASYNWGEHRVLPRLDKMGLENTAEDRNYWQFYGKYSDQLPHQTEDYVLKIFTAAVIGEDPELFGFDFENPLAPYATGTYSDRQPPELARQRLITTSETAGSRSLVEMR